VRVRVLGSLTVTDAAGRPAAAGTLPRRARQVLGVLAARHDRLQSKDALADAVWADALPGNHVATLEHYVSLLRRRLQPGVRAADSFLVTRSGGYLFDTGRAALDLADLRERVRLLDGGAAPAAAYQDIVALTEQPAFPEDAYADWAEAVRVEARAARFTALVHLADSARATEPARALRLARQAVELDPYAERAYQVAIAAALDLGRPDEAQRLFDRCRASLAADLGVAPSPGTVRLADAIHAAREPRPVATDRPVFVGRDVETALVLGDAPAPVVHVVGPAGAGKTALLEQLRRVAPHRVGLGHAPGGSAQLRLSWLRSALAALGVDPPAGDGGVGDGGVGDGGVGDGPLDHAGLARIAAALDRPEPVVLAVDEADNLDATSVDELAWLVRNRPGLRVVLAYRYPSAVADRPLAALGSPLVLRLEPLTAAELAPLGGADLAARTGGPTLRCCAVLGPLLPAELATLLDATPAEVVDCVDRLVHAHLLVEQSDGRLRHRASLVAEAVAGQVSAAAASRLRDRLGTSAG
jgi:DNA-binding SARP family transcriptional activator